MAEKIKKTVILIFLILTIVSFPYDISYGIYFGVLTNVLVNVFWTANLFCFKKPSFRKNSKTFGFAPYDNSTKNNEPRRPAL